MLSDLCQMPEWKALEAHYDLLKPISIRDFFQKNPARFDDFHIEIGGLLFDYSKHHINAETIELLGKFATARDFKAAQKALFSGDPVNKSEGRAALHTALRAEAYPNPDVESYVRETKEKIKSLSDQIRANKNITDVINIGIGGSDLGARMVCEALSHLEGGPRLHFLANIDGDEITTLLKKLKSQNTFVLVVSKTFTTLETLENAKIVRKWAKRDHMVAVTSNIEEATKFGIHQNHILPLKNWIGGRYSLWSAAGLSIAIRAGFENFERLLAGARAGDVHFQDAPLEKNIPVLMALLGIWYRNFFDYRAHAILPYAKALKYFPPYMQQLDMESNGKAAATKTGPIVFGGTGTKVQHAFFQHLHQSPDITPADFILAAKPHHDLEGHHEKLNANALAQAQALMEGQSNPATPHQNFPGNRPSSVFILDEISPYCLGLLLSFYEHKIFTQGILWGINSFDQWGVELGKALAKNITNALENGSTPHDMDSSTYNLIKYIQKQNT